MSEPIIARGSLGGRVVRRRDSAGFVFTTTRHRPGLMVPRHANDRATMIAVLGGEYDETLGGRTHRFAPGSLIVRPPGEIHSNRIGGQGAACLLIELTADRLAAVRDHEQVFDRPRTMNPGPAAFPARRVVHELAHPDAATPLLLEGLALEILAHVVRGPVPREPRPTRTWLERALERLSVVEGESMPTLGELARLVGRHPVYLARAFRARFGCSVGEYARRRRIVWTCEQLSDSARPVAEIAAGAGFHDQSHLSRVFRRYTGSSPAAFRRAARRGSADARRVRLVLDAAAAGGHSGDDLSDA
jgi:AraC family transcriptional regulator